MSLKVVFDGFDTIEQAQAFISWYGCTGEQDSSAYLEDTTDLDVAYLNVNRPYEYTEDSITCYLELFYKEESIEEE